MKYLIIGAGAAAVNAAEAIRSVDKKSSITLLSAENVMPYGKPLISYLLSGKQTESKMFYRPAEFYKKLNIDVKLSSEVAKINVKNKTVITKNNKTFSYDKLLIASGSAPFVPPIENLSKQKNAFTFLTYGEAKKIKAAASANSNVVIVGAGLIGLKAAEGLYGKVKSITVVDLAPHIMANAIDQAPAAIIQKHIASKGIEFKFNLSVKSASENKVTLSNNETLQCDLLILAVGVRPNIAFIEGTGIKTEKGIIVDDTMQASVKGVYAAGDCAVSRDILSGAQKVMALWPNAAWQGQTAGLNMAGAKTIAPQSLSMNAISFFGMQLISAGMQTSKAHTLKDGANSFARLSIDGNFLTGFTLINDFRRAGIYTHLIKTKTPLSELSYDITKKDIGLNVFSASDRRKKLFGGL